MFNIKNYTNNLQYTERFNYTLYQYYNDYEKSTNFKNDTKKIFFNCRRKTIGTIVKHQTKKSSVISDCRLIKMSQPSPLQSIEAKYQLNNEMIDQNQEFNKSIFDNTDKITMEQFLDSFADTFEQANYTDFPDGVLEINKNTYRIMLYPDQLLIKVLSSSTHIQNKLNKQFGSPQLLYFLQQITKNDRKRIIEMNQNDSIPIQDLDFYRLRLAYQQFSSAIILATGVNQSKNIQQLVKINMFMNLISKVLSEIFYGDGLQSSYLILFVPNLCYFRYMLNPVVLAVSNYLREEESESKSDQQSFFQPQKKIPRICVINLTGKQTPLNIQIVQERSDNYLFYVTIYEENFGKYERFAQNFEQKSEINQFYDQFLLRLIKEANSSAHQNRKASNSSLVNQPKILAFPLNSRSVQQKISQVHKNNPNKSHINMKGTSQQLLFLFQEVILQQIQKFSPHIIVISYNDNLRLHQNHFNYIIRKLTLISHHRLVLFPDFCNLFQNININKFFETCSKSINEESATNMEDIESIVQFLQDYHHQQFHHININSLFNNFGMFLKISSGAYLMDIDKKILYTESSKYNVGHKYLYLECLAQVPQLKRCFANYGTQKRTSGADLTKLLQTQKINIIKKNIHKYKYHQKIIDTAINNIISNTLDKQKQYKAIRLILKFNNQQQNQHITEISRKNILSEYLQTIKQDIILEIMSTQKITKIYNFITKSTTLNQSNVKMYKLFYLRNLEEQKFKENILLDRYTQAIFTPDQSLIFLVNFFDPIQQEFCFMYGVIEEGSFEVQMKKINEYGLYYQQVLHQFRTYLCYSYCFDVRNCRLLLYWPYQWDAVKEMQSRMLDMEYQAEIVHKLVVIQYKELPPSVASYTSLGEQKFCVPRYGSSAWISKQSTLYIFGGIYTNQRDFDANCTNSGISIMQLQKNKKFEVRDVPKNQLQSMKLRPKINYIIQQHSNGIQLIIRGGYGREFTNFYHIYCYNQYRFNLVTNLLTSKQVQRQIVTIQQPLKTHKAGYFEQIKSQTILQRTNQHKKLQNKNKMKQAHHFSMINNGTIPKYKFINGQVFNGNPMKSIAFTDSEYTTKPRLTSNIKQLNRQKLSTHTYNLYEYSYNSPEILIIDHRTNQLLRIAILIKNYQHCTKEYNITDYMLPNEDQIISKGIDRLNKKLYIFCCSFIQTNGRPTIFQANLKDMENVFNKRQIRAQRIFQFVDMEKFDGMFGKGVHCARKVSVYDENCYNEEGEVQLIENKHKIDDKSEMIKQYYKQFAMQGARRTQQSCQIFITGGNYIQDGYRQDYKLFKSNHQRIFQVSIGRFSVPEQQNNRNILSMPNPFTIQSITNPNQFLLYSVSLNNDHQWQLKIQCLSYISLQRHTIKISPLMACTVLKQNRIYQISPDFQQPIFTNIQKYNYFSFNNLRNQLEIIKFSATKLATEIQNKNLTNQEEIIINIVQEIVIFTHYLSVGQFNNLVEFFMKYKEVSTQSQGSEEEMEIQEESEYIGQNNEKEQFSSSWDQCIRKYLSIIYRILQCNLVQIRKYFPENRDSSYLFSASASICIVDLAQSINQSLVSLIYLRMEDIGLKFLIQAQENNSPKPQNLYRFFIQDKKQPLAKYIALGYLDAPNLIFFRMKYGHPVALPINLSQNKTNNSLNDINGQIAQFGYNIISKSINQIIFSNEKQAMKILKFQDQYAFIKISDIEKYEADTQYYEVKQQWVTINQGYENYTNT